MKRIFILSDYLRISVVALAVCLTILASVAAYHSLRHLIGAQALVNHTEAVINEIQQFSSTLETMEVSVRNHVITGNPRDIALIDGPSQALAAQIGRLQNLTRDNPNQQRRLEKLKPLVRDELSTVAAMLKEGSAGGIRALADGKLVQGSQDLAGKIEAILGDMGGEEHSLYARRLGSAAANAHWLLLIFVGMTGFSAAAICLVMFWMSMEIRRRRIVEAELRKAKHELEDRVRVRSGQLNEAESELTRTRSFLDLVVENIPGAVVVKSASDHRYVLFNRSAEMVLGYDRNDVIGKTDQELFPKEQAEFFVARDKEVVLSRALQIIPQQEVTTRDGQRRYWRVKKLPILDEQGEPKYILGLAEDITERRAAEAQLVQAQKMEAIGNLTGGMAHDFNNLLAVIIGNVDVLRGMIKDNAAADELANEALDAALRGAELTRRLLAFARRQPLKPVGIDVNELVDGMTKLLSRTLGEDVEISVKASEDLWPVIADAAQLEAALTNLATNARDAMANGGRLMISTGNRQLDEDYASQHTEVAPGDYVMIEVSDTGTGMPPEVVSRIFEPFFTTKPQGQGTGLGLSMVFGFIKQSGGHINVYSEPGAGTTFRLYLPRTTEGSGAEERAASEEMPTGHGEAVLVVEDNAALRRIVVRQVHELGYRVLEAENAAEALSLLEKERVDVVFTDVVMPGERSGIDLARTAADRWAGTRVLLTSGFSGTKIGGGPESAAFTHILSKPYRRSELAQALRTILEE